MSKFGVKIDLSAFFEDERKMVLVMVDVEMWKTVSDLQKRVETLFDIEAKFLHDGCFLPPEETIEILKFCKDLKAFAPKESNNQRKARKNKAKREHYPEDGEAQVAESFKHVEVEPNEMMKKKRKYHSLGCDLTSSTPNNSSKRIKNSFSAINATIRHDGKKQGNKSSEITSTSGENMLPILPVESVDKTTKTKKNKKPNGEYPYLVLQHEEEQDRQSNAEHHINTIKPEDILNNSSNLKTIKQKKTHPERKTRDNRETSNNTTESCDNNTAHQKLDSHNGNTMNNSKRNHKYSKKPDENSIELSIPPPRLSGLPSSTFINDSRNLQKEKRASNNPFRKNCSHLKHIHFNETGEISTTITNGNADITTKEECPKSTVIVKYHCQLENTDPKKPRIFEISQTAVKEKRDANQIKSLIEIKENILINPLQPLKSAELVLTPTGDNDNEAESMTAVSSNNDETVEIPSADGNIVQDDEETEKNALDSSNISEKSVNALQANESKTANNTTVADKSLAATQIEDLDASNNHASNNTSVEMKDDMESSIQSVDCVDLSIDIDEDNETSNRNQTTTSIQDISISDTSDVEEVIDLNETDDHNNTSTPNISRRLSNSVKVSKIIGMCKDTTDMPILGDIMIFKVPFTNRQGNPDCTKFMAAKVERIQQRTKSLKLLILDGHSELFYISEKYFDRYMENSQCEQKYLQIKLSEMIQPRILPKNKMPLL
uniref:Coilin N-terminal domain-containing protein n=1 Tax=Stomoxys calcitrans TaxID=35570 RepID=A0A1I8NSW6_STOCA